MKNRFALISLLSFVTLIANSSCAPEQSVCISGETQSCLCPGAVNGAQVCASDGQSWGNCECGQASDAGTDQDASTNSDATSLTDLGQADVSQGDTAVNADGASLADAGSMNDAAASNDSALGDSAAIQDSATENDAGQATQDAANTESDASGSDAASLDANSLDANSSAPLQIKDLQDQSSSRFPGIGNTVSLTSVVVTSPVFRTSSTLDAFFISDVEGGAYSGILVVAATGEVTVNINDLVDIVGTLTEFSGASGNSGTETQIALTQINVHNSVSPVAATVATSSHFATDLSAEPWEGVLVKLENVNVQLFADGSLTSYGQFQVSEGALIGDEFLTYLPGRSEIFTSITGVVRYSFYGDFVIEPRSANDIVSASGARVMTDSSIVSVQNPEASDHPVVCASPNDRCDPVRLTNVVVTSPVFGITRESTCLDLENDHGCPYYLFGFYVADPNAVDADGRMQPWSGIKIAFNPGTRWLRGSECDGLYDEAYLNCGGPGLPNPDLSSNYDFSGYYSKDMANQDPSVGFPAIGDILTIIGEPSEYHDVTQLGYLQVLNKSGNTSDSNSAFSQPLSALFTGDVSNIFSGLPRVPEFGDPELRAAMNEGADAEKYEGVLIELRNVDSLNSCVEYPYNNDPNQMQDFGYFRVAGSSETLNYKGVEIGTFFKHGWGGWWLSPYSGGPNYADRTCANTVNKCDERRIAGQHFDSIKGVLDFSYGVHRLEPFNVADIVCSGNLCTPQSNPDFCQ